MLIDWFTIVAQAINFLVLVVVLKYVLYDRIVAVIDRRQADIAGQIAQAEERETQAAAERTRFERLSAELDDERDRLLAAARDEAAEERRHMVEAARDEVQTLRSRWVEGIERERDRLLAALEQHAADELVALSEQALGDLADAQLEEQIVAVGLQRLAETDVVHATGWDRGAGTGVAVVVATALPLSEHRRQDLTERVRAVLGAAADVEIVTDTDLICGLELRVGDHAFGWSVSTYLRALRRRVDDYLQEELGLERVVRPPDLRR